VRINTVMAGTASHNGSKHMKHIKIFGAERMHGRYVILHKKKETMMEDIDEGMEVRFEANLVKVVRVDGDGNTMKKGNAGSTLRILCSTLTPNARPFISVNELRNGRIIFLANIQRETQGAVHQSDKRVVTMFLVDESFHKVMFFL
jgi:hypothetical protein